jgi:hypothetical protein
VEYQYEQEDQFRGEEEEEEEGGVHSSLIPAGQAYSRKVLGPGSKSESESVAVTVTDIDEESAGEAESVRERRMSF